MTRLLVKVRRPSRAEIANDAYDAGKQYGERLGRLLAQDLYRVLVESAKQQNLTPAQLAEVAEFVDAQATERLAGGAR
jgi:hypothetical protein